MGALSLSLSLSLKQHIHPVQLLHLPQTHRRRDPDKADQSAHLLPHPDRIAGNVQAGNGPLESFCLATISIAITAGDA